MNFANLTSYYDAVRTTAEDIRAFWRANFGKSLLTTLFLATIVIVKAYASTHGEFSGTLIFCANDGSNWEIYRYRSGQEPSRITTNKLDSRVPQISPDSSQVSYVTSDGSLWVVSLKSGNSRQLAAPFFNGRYGFPTWLSDGLLAYTVYSVTPPTEDSDIFAYSYSDRKQRLVIRQSGSQDFPAASRSGKQIAYMSSITTLISGFGATTSQQLWVASLHTGKLDQLTTGSFRDTRPAWSPDEQRIAFSSDRDGRPQIWVVDVSTKALMQLTTNPGENTDPAWSPDGRQIVYVSTASGHRELNLIEVDTRKTTTLHPFGARPVEIRDPAWSN